METGGAAIRPRHTKAGGGIIGESRRALHGIALSIGQGRVVLAGEFETRANLAAQGISRAVAGLIIGIAVIGGVGASLAVEAVVVVATGIYGFLTLVIDQFIAGIARGFTMMADPGNQRITGIANRGGFALFGGGIL